jgi:hypothetical protein
MNQQLKIVYPPSFNMSTYPLIGIFSGKRSFLHILKKNIIHLFLQNMTF